MVEVSVSSEDERQRFAAIGRALGDPKRLCVLESLAAGEMSVSELSRVFVHEYSTWNETPEL